jgi:hypothetical protein
LIAFDKTNFKKNSKFAGSKKLEDGRQKTEERRKKLLTSVSGPRSSDLVFVILITK